MRTRMAWLGTAWVVCSALALAQSSSASIFDKIRAEGYDRSQTAAVFNTLTIDIGPRLTASPAHKRAAEYMRGRLAAYGLANARLEPWKFGRGWTLEHLTVEMIEPRYLPLIGYADAWRPDRRHRHDAADDDRFRPEGPSQPSEPTYVPNSAAYATSVGRPAQP